MKTVMIAVAGAAAAGALVGLSVTACSSKSDKATTSTSTSSSHSAASTSAAATQSPSAQAEAADYSTLLIKASDIVLPGDSFTAAPPTQNPNGKPGVAMVFSNQGDTREIGDTILLLPDAAGAATAADGARARSAAR